MKSYPRFFVSKNASVIYRLDNPKGPTKIFMNGSKPRVTDIWTSFDFNESVQNKLIKEIPAAEAALLI